MEALKGVRGTEEAIKKLISLNIPPERGPYSNSRLKLCQESFWHNYINKTEKTKLTRFGRDIGSALHEIVEIDTKIRATKDEDNWPSIENLIDIFLRKRPQYINLQDDLMGTIERFRESFVINKEYYMGSEERLGCNLAGEPRSFTSSEAWFRGVIDYLEIDSSNVARVVDFKNYPTIHKEVDFNDPRSDIGGQLMGYATLVAFNYPSVNEFVYEVYYLRYGVSKTSSSLDDDNTHVIRVVTRDEIDSYWRTVQRKMIAWERLSNFIAEPSSKNCQYCDYIFSCSYMKESDSDEIITNDDQAVDALGRLVVLDEHRKRLSKSLKSYSEAHGIIESSHMKYGSYMKENTDYDVSKFVEIILKNSPQYISELLNVDKRALDKYIRNECSQETLKEIEGIMTKSYSTRTGLRKK